MAKYTNIQSGVALLMTLGILALLSILGVAFSTSMRVMERTTRDFVYEMQARYLAEGGVEYAIAELKEDARNKFVWNNNVAVENKYDLLSGIGSIENVEIKDCASKININYASKELLDTVIKGIGPKSSEDIVEQRNGPDGKPGRADHDDDSDGVTDEADELGAEESDDSPFLTPKSIGIVRDVYENNKDIMTTWGYCDPNTQDSAGNNSPRSAINVHTADSELIKLLAKAINGVSKNDANTFAKVIDAEEFHSWKEFKDKVETLGDVEELMNNFNPNKHKPGWDRNAASTEICLHSSGTYEITATGKITKNNQLLAKKTITTAAKIFGLWNQTTMKQFRKVWESDKRGEGEEYSSGDLFDGEIVRVTWYDTCPVMGDDNWNGTYTMDTSYNKNLFYFTIMDSLKIGFWDDFSDVEFSESEWIDIEEHNPSRIHFSNGILDMDQWGRVVLADSNKWEFGNMSLHILEDDRNSPIDSSEETELAQGWLVGTVYFRYIASFNENGVALWQRSYEPIDSPHGFFVVYGGSSEWLDPYVQKKAFKVILGPDGTRRFLINYSPETSLSFLNPGNTLSSLVANLGRIKLWNASEDPPQSPNSIWDNIRIIPDSGYYISTPYSISDPVEWGTLWGTVTIPGSVVNEEDVEIKFQLSTDAGTSWTGEASLTGDNEDGIPISKSGQLIQYRANFYSSYSNDNQYSKTPVLEDVWITYLPRTKILYWKEGAEE